MRKFGLMKLVCSIISIFLCLSGCQLDECDTLDCLNAGRCIHGNCECAPGFEGPNCNVREIDKFLGTFHQGTGVCNGTKAPLGTHVISEVPFDHQAILIDDGVFDHPILARVEGWNFVIAEQANSYSDPILGVSEEMKLIGQGWLDLSANRLVYKLDNSDCQYELLLQPG